MTILAATGKGESSVLGGGCVASDERELLGKMGGHDEHYEGALAICLQGGRRRCAGACSCASARADDGGEGV